MHWEGVREGRSSIYRVWTGELNIGQNEGNQQATHIIITQRENKVHSTYVIAIIIKIYIYSQVQELMKIM